MIDNNLLVKAEAQEEINTISTLLQDSIVPHTLMMHHKKDDVFRVMVNRFCWERPSEYIEDQEVYFRVHSALFIKHVEKVSCKGIDPKDFTDMHNLLAIRALSDKELELVFSGRGEIRVNVKGILCYLRDLHEPWPTLAKPTHRIIEKKMK